MVKKVKCSQCKYLKIPSSQIEKDYLDNIIHNIFARNPDIDISDFVDSLDEKIILFGCEANKEMVSLDSQIDKPRECQFFRNNTLTAWQEVRQDIWGKIKSLNPISIIKSFFGK